RLLATADQGGGIRLWDAATGRPVRKLADTFKPRPANANGYYTSLAFTRDSRKLVSLTFTLSVGCQRTVCIWDVAGNGKTQEFRLKQAGLQNKIALSPDGKFIVLFNDGITSGCLIIETETGQESLLDTAYGVAAFAPNGRNLVVGSDSFNGYSLAILDHVVR